MIQNYDLGRSNGITFIACPVNNGKLEDRRIILLRAFIEDLVRKREFKFPGREIRKGRHRAEHRVRCATTGRRPLVQPRTHGSEYAQPQIPLFIRKFEFYIQVAARVDDRIDRCYRDLGLGVIAVLAAGNDSYQQYGGYQKWSELHETDLIGTNLQVFAQKR